MNQDAWMSLAAKNCSSRSVPVVAPKMPRVMSVPLAALPSFVLILRGGQVSFLDARVEWDR